MEDEYCGEQVVIPALPSDEELVELEHLFERGKPRMLMEHQNIAAEIRHPEKFGFYRYAK